MNTCYKPYVSRHKQCPKTTIIEKVTCHYCINRLLREGKAEIHSIKEKEQ